MLNTERSRHKLGCNASAETGSLLQEKSTCDDSGVWVCAHRKDILRWMEPGYLLSELDVEGAAVAGATVASGAPEAAVGVASLFEEPEASMDDTDEPPESPFFSLSLLDADGLAFPYPSLNQPPPLKEMAAAETTRSNKPPQCGHSVIS